MTGILIFTVLQSGTFIGKFSHRVYDVERNDLVLFGLSVFFETHTARFTISIVIVQQNKQGYRE